MMDKPIVCWLKIRNRNNDQFVIEHLDRWLHRFEDESKYKIMLYNEDFNLPERYDRYNPLNRKDLMDNSRCQDLWHLISESKISSKWLRTAFALAAPYWWFEEDQIMIGVDGDDMEIYGELDRYIEQAIRLIQQHDLITLSYDYILSHNFFDNPQRNVQPNQWSFGLCLAQSGKMKRSIMKILKNTEHYIRQVNNVDRDYEVNLDLLMSVYLQKERVDQKYIAFLTNAGFAHRGFPAFQSYFCQELDGKFRMDFLGLDIRKEIHEKTAVLKYV